MLHLANQTRRLRNRHDHARPSGQARRQTQVTPGLVFLRWAAQQVGGVVGHDERNTAEVVRTAAHAAHRIVGTQQVLCRNLADGQDDLRLDQFDLSLEVLAAGGSLIGFRVAVIRWTAFQDIRDEHTVPALPDREQHLIQQLPARPTKGSPRRSSSAPGASPIISQSACWLPTPKTVLLRLAESSQRVQRRRTRAAPASRGLPRRRHGICWPPPGSPRHAAARRQCPWPAGRRVVAVPGESSR